MAPCLIERCICWGELVSPKWQTAFVCGKEKEMVRTGPEALICCWQTDSLARWPLWPESWLSPHWHCNVCSHRQLLLKVIHALKIHLALIEALNRNIPLQHRKVNTVFSLYWSLLFTVISVLFFPSTSDKDLFEAIVIPFSSSTSMEQLACTWSIDVSRHRGRTNLHVFCGATGILPRNKLAF